MKLNNLKGDKMKFVNYIGYKESLINGKKAATNRLRTLEKMYAPVMTKLTRERIDNEMDDCIAAIASFDARIKLDNELNPN